MNFLKIDFKVVIISIAIGLSLPASANELFQLSGNFQSIDDNVVVIDELRKRLENIELHSDDASLSNIMKYDFLTDAIVSELEEACGHAVELDDFFKRHQFQAFTLKSDEVYLLNACVTGIFEFADIALGFAAPGLYKRYSPKYISEVVELGYSCGYRSQRLLSRFALSSWLFHPRDLKEIRKFRCLGDQTIEYKYTERSLEWGVARISDEAIFATLAFESWSDAIKYREYVSLVKRNREAAMCEELVSFPFEDEPFQRKLLSESGCLEILAPAIGD